MRICVVGDLNRTSNSCLVADQLEQYGVDVIRIGPQAPLFELLRRAQNVDVVYGIARGWSWRLFASVKFLGKLSVNHWIGTDVFSVLSNRSLQRQVKLSNFFIDKQLAVAPHLSVELATIGLKTVVVPTVPDLADIKLRKSIPDKISVLAYLPDARPKFYGAEIIYRLAREFYQLPFLIVAGTSEVQQKLSNIQYLGFVQDMDYIYEQAPILIRIPEHDGLPKMVLEALAKGNQVIFKYDFPQCYKADTFSEAANSLTQILANGCPVNKEGHDYVTKCYNRHYAIEKLLAVFQKHSSL